MLTVTQNRPDTADGVRGPEDRQLKLGIGIAPCPSLEALPR
jgi:hypothetical protein